LSHFSFDGGAGNHAALQVKKRALENISSLYFVFEVKVIYGKKTLTERSRLCLVKHHLVTP
jgi:hypothetical protein